MVFDMVDAIIRGQGKRAAAMPGVYRGYLVMAPRDLFPSIAQHRVQAAATATFNPSFGLPLQMMTIPGWPPFVWRGMPPWTQPHQGASGQAPPPPPGLLQQHYPHLFATPPTLPAPAPVVAVAVPPCSGSSPARVKVEKHDAKRAFDSLITSSLAKGVQASKARGGDHPAAEAAVDALEDARPEPTTVAPAAPSPTRRASRGVRGSPRPASRSKSRSRSRSRERKRDQGGRGRYGPQPVAEGQQRSEPARGDREGKAPYARPRSHSRSPEARSRRGRDWGREEGQREADSVIREHQGRSCYNAKVRRRIRLRDPGPSSTWPDLCVCRCRTSTATRSRPVIAVPLFTPATPSSCHSSASFTPGVSLAQLPANSTTLTSSTISTLSRR
jgi:hypothetical protein